MSWNVYCDFRNDIDETTAEAIKLPGIYGEGIDAKEAVRVLVRQKANELSSEGLFITCEDVYMGEVSATDGYGRYVSYSYYVRRPYQVLTIM
ncbi:MAG: hypothetical protein IJ195_08855 [Lachnospiraceae bacterium]|nr:hypothetical protein [Lachnospiraceae bacterium]